MFFKNPKQKLVHLYCTAPLDSIYHQKILKYVFYHAYVGHWSIKIILSKRIHSFCDDMFIIFLHN